MAQVDADEPLAEHRLHMARIERQRAIETLVGFVVAAQQQQRHAAIAVSVGIIRLQRDRAVMRGDGLDRPAGASASCRGRSAPPKVRLERDRPFLASALPQAFEFEQREPRLGAPRHDAAQFHRRVSAWSASSIWPESSAKRQADGGRRNDPAMSLRICPHSACASAYRARDRRSPAADKRTPPASCTAFAALRSERHANRHCLTNSVLQFYSNDFSVNHMIGTLASVRGCSERIPDQFRRGISENRPACETPLAASAPGTWSSVKFRKASREQRRMVSLAGLATPVSDRAARNR